MSALNGKAPLSVKDIDRLTALATDVADHGRIAGLELGSLLEETVAESTELEAARLRYIRGEDSDAARDEARRLKAAAKAARRRGEAFASETKAARETLNKVLDKNPDEAVFRLEVAVTDSKEQPAAGLDLHLFRGKAQLDKTRTDSKGLAEFRLIARPPKPENAEEQARPVEVGSAAKADGAFTRRGSIERVVPVEVEPGKSARLTVLARDAKGNDIGRGTIDSELKPGDTARIDIQLG